MTLSQSISVVVGHENVFEDLGFSGEEAVNLRIRADLMLELRSFIETKGWTQQDAAVFFDETQTRIGNLMNGDINRFSVDKLLIMLTKAGMGIKFEVFPVLLQSSNPIL